MLTMGCSGPTKSSLVNEGGGGNASVSSRKARYCAFVTQYLSIQKASSVTSRWGRSSAFPVSEPIRKDPAGTYTIAASSFPLFVSVTSFIFVSLDSYAQA